MNTPGRAGPGLTLVAWGCAALVGCASAPPAVPPQGPVEELPQATDLSPSPPSAFEQSQRERALNLMRQRRLADAALAWEVLVVLRPGVREYRERLDETQRLIDAAVAERLPRAAQLARRGELDQASREYLAVLALQPLNEAAADALRAIERERNKRYYLGKHSRVTIMSRAKGDAEMPVSASLMALSNEVEHAALLAGDGEFDDAIALLERRLAAQRHDASARRLLASVYYRKAESLAPGDKRAAIEALEKSVRLDPTEPRAISRLKQLKTGAAKPSAITTSGGVPAAALAAPSPGADSKPER